MVHTYKESDIHAVEGEGACSVHAMITLLVFGFVYVVSVIKEE